jgi:hypothetical protein
MVATVRFGHRALIPCCAGPNHDQAVGYLTTVAERAVQRRADPSISLGSVFDPGCRPERRTMTDVLPAVALEQRHPLPDVVSNKADDPAYHGVERTSGLAMRSARHRRASSSPVVRHRAPPTVLAAPRSWTRGRGIRQRRAVIPRCGVRYRRLATTSQASVDQALSDVSASGRGAARSAPDVSVWESVRSR